MRHMAEPGYLWAVIQGWLDAQRYPPSQRQLARAIGVSHGLITEWKYARAFAGPKALERLAEELRVPYEVVLDAALNDAGYRSPEPKHPERNSNGSTRTGT